MVCWDFDGLIFLMLLVKFEFIEFFEFSILFTLGLTPLMIMIGAKQETLFFEHQVENQQTCDTI